MSMSKTINGIVTWLRSWFYTKTEVDSLVGSISIEDTDLFDVLDCINNNFDNFSGYIFYDGGVTGNVNTNYVKSHSGVSATVSRTGTTVSSTTYADCFYIADVLLPNDWIAEFTIVSVNAFGGIAFLNSNKEFQWHIEYNLIDSPKSFQFRVGEITETISNDYTMPSTIKLIKEGTSLEIYLNNTLISTKTITDMTGYLGWKTHSRNNRSVTFKEFKVEPL